MRGADPAPATATPSSSSPTDSTVLYPMRGVSDLARLTPAAVRGEVRRPARTATPSSRPSWARPPTTCPACPGVGQGYAAKWINQFDGLDNVIARADEITGKKGEALREHLGDVIRNRQLNALVRDLTLPVRPDDLAPPAVGPHRRARAPRRARVPRRAAQPPVRHDRPRSGRRDRRRGGLRARRRAARPRARSPRWLDGARAGGRRGSASPSQGTWRAGTGEVRLRRAGDRATGRPPGSTWPTVDAGGRRSRSRLAGRPGAAQGAARRQGPDARAGRARLASSPGSAVDTALAAYLVQPDQRSYDLADLTLRYLKRELRPGHRRRRPAQLRRDRRHRRPATPRCCTARAVLDLADALDDAVDEHGGTALLRRRRAAADRHPRPDGAGRASRSTPTTSRALESEFGDQVRAAADRRLRRHRQGDQPRLAQAAAGGAVRRARHAQDQAHQDRLHHRRRRAAAALREDRAPVPAAPAAPPRRDPAAPDRRGAAQDRRLRRPDPHDLQPDHRRDGPALEHRPQPAEHPDPHRGGSPHPRGLRRRRGR